MCLWGGGRCSRYKKVLYLIEPLSGSGRGVAGCLEEVEGTGRVKGLEGRGKRHFSAKVLVFPTQNNFKNYFLVFITHRKN